MTQASLACKGNRHRRLHRPLTCDAPDTERRSTQSCVKHDRAHMHEGSSGIGSMSRMLIIFGLLLVAIGLLWPWLQKLGLGRLPGDFVIRRDGFTLYAPIATGILLSILLSAVLWLLRR